MSKKIFRRNFAMAGILKAIILFIAMIVLGFTWDVLVKQFHINSTVFAGTVLFMLVPVAIYKVTKLVIKLKSEYLD